MQMLGYIAHNIVGPRGTHGVIFDFIHKLERPQQIRSSRKWHAGKSYMSAEDCVKAMIHLIGHCDKIESLQPWC